MGLQWFSFKLIFIACFSSIFVILRNCWNDPNYFYFQLTEKAGSKDGGGSSRKGRRRGPASENSLEEMKQKIETERKRLKVSFAIWLI